jgi:hypothetical protein
LSSKADFKRFGMKKEEKDIIDEQEYKYGKSDNKERRNIGYLTNRKKRLNIFERILEFFCCCFFSKVAENYDDEEPEDTGNIKIVDFLIFEPKAAMYQVWKFFICFMCMFSCYYYLYITAGRFYVDDDHELIWGYEPYIFATVCIEIAFFVDMILLCFKMYAP